MFNKLSNGMQVNKLALAVPKLLMLKLFGFTGISKIEFSNFLELKGSKLLPCQNSNFVSFLVLKGVTKWKKVKNHSKLPNYIIQSILNFKQMPNIFLFFQWSFNTFASCIFAGRVIIWTYFRIAISQKPLE